MSDTESSHNTCLPEASNSAVSPQSTVLIAAPLDSAPSGDGGKRTRPATQRTPLCPPQSDSPSQSPRLAALLAGWVDSRSTGVTGEVVEASPPAAMYEGPPAVMGPPKQPETAEVEDHHAGKWVAEARASSWGPSWFWKRGCSIGGRACSSPW